MVADRMRRWEVPGYDVAELIGFGASGEVWLARERSTGDPVALKRLRPVPGGRPSPLAGGRVAREAALLAALRHPHLLRLREVLPGTDGMSDGGSASGLVLVLDHAAGGSLASLLAVRGTLAPGEVVTVAAPLAEALAHVHARGLVHGDVTPANVLLTGDGRPLLADLGVARLLGEQLGAVEGTPDYADPAVLGGAAPTPAADVYGLAATALTALCGPLAAGGQGGPGQPWELPRMQGLAPTAPQPLLEVLAAALAPRPEDRPDAAELAVALHDACPPQPLRRRPARPFALDDAAEEAAPTGHAAGGADSGGTARAASQPAGAVARPEAGTRVISRPRQSAAAAAAPRRRRLRPPALPDRGRSGGSLGLRAVVLVLALVAALAGATAVLVDRTSGAAASSAAGRSERPTPAPAPTVERAPGGGARAAGTAADRASPAAASTAAASTAAAAVDESDWVEVMTTLYAGRSQAFAAADPAMLASVYAPGSADLASNTALVRQLAADGARVPDLRLEVRRAAPVATASPSTGKDRMLLDVVDVLAPYELTDVGGRLLERRPGRGAQQVRVELLRVDGAWLIARTSLPAPA